MVKMSKCIECGVNEIDETKCDVIKGFCSEKCKNIYYWKLENNASDFNNIICPYCKNAFYGDDEFNYEDGEKTIVCHSCGKKFEAQRNSMVTFSTFCLPEYYEELGELANE